MREQPGTFVLVEVDQDLGVAGRPEVMPAGFEAAAEGGEVVNFAVEDGPDRPVLVRERLVAAGEVDDRQATEPQRGVRVKVHP